MSKRNSKGKAEKATGWSSEDMIMRLKDENPEERKLALEILCEYAENPRKVTTNKFASIITELKRLHEDPVIEIRMKVAECIGCVATTEAGCAVIEAYDLCQELLSLVADSDQVVKIAAITAVHRAAISPICVKALTQLDSIKQLFDMLVVEIDKNIIISILKVLKPLLNAATSWDLGYTENQIGLLGAFMRSSYQEIKIEAASVIQILCEGYIDEIGKDVTRKRKSSAKKPLPKKSMKEAAGNKSVPQHAVPGPDPDDEESEGNSDSDESEEEYIRNIPIVRYPPRDKPQPPQHKDHFSRQQPKDKLPE